jgi:hypothetical protein
MYFTGSAKARPARQTNKPMVQVMGLGGGGQRLIVETDLFGRLVID